MLIKKKWLCYVYIVLGIIIAGSNTILFFGYERTVFQALMIATGIGFLFIGVSNLRRLQKTNST